MFDDEAKMPSRVHQIGEELELLSVDELHQRMDQLRNELHRLESELNSKGTTKAAAEALFKI